MKRILLIIICAIVYSCSVQEKNYSTKVEMGIRGKVKEETTIIYKVEDNQISTDSSFLIGKYISTFDKSGNAIEKYKTWNLEIISSIKNNKIIYSGTGKNISYKDISTFENGAVVVGNFKYVWLDNFHYKIIENNDTSTYQNIITLDKNFRLLKSDFKEGDFTEILSEIETTYDSKKITRIKTQTSEKRPNENITYLQLQIVKEYDSYKNPTLIYIYDNIDEKQIKEVLFKSYKYY